MNAKQTSQAIAITTMLGIIVMWDGAFLTYRFQESQSNPLEVIFKTTSTPFYLSQALAQTPKKPSIAQFMGRWSSEGNVQATHLMQLEINREYEGLSGVLKAESYKDDSSSGILSIFSETEGERVIVKILDQKGYEVGEAELSLDGEVLVWRLIKARGIAAVTLPSIAYLYSVDELNF